MAGAVWGIDIGQCALRALQGRAGSDGKVVAESFDYVEYPKITSQPDADPDQLIRDALKLFLSRNSLRGDKVAISVSGQAGLARYINLPPVEDKQLPKLVGFEAKQQIPFALEDVVWDYQKMPGLFDDEEEEDVPENLVGIFAIKRDQVMRIIRPLIDAEVELDIIQLAPISIYNAVTFDLFPQGEEAKELNPSDWTAVLSMGTESSDLVMTNGYKLWQRNIPIGGNHFTKQLTQELKLTFAKAEHVKRNAREASDAREIFRAMRPTFGDLVTELQRSISYFQSLDKGVEEKNIARFVAVGNPFKLPGLTQYLEKNLSQKVLRFEDFNRLSGPEVLEEPAFKDNAMSFPVCYGLVVQGIGDSKLRTNLVPREIVQQRLIRRKKPWAAAIAAAVLLGMAFNYFFNWRAWDSVHEDFSEGGTTWKAVASQVSATKSKSSGFESSDQTQSEELDRLDGIGEMAVGSADGRLLWLELLKAITAALPEDPDQRPGRPLTLDEKPLEQRLEIYITAIESEYFEDLSTWFNEDLQAKYQTLQEIRQNRQRIQLEQNGAADSQDEGGVQDVGASAEVAMPDVSGSGWVIELQGHHFQHNDTPGEGAEYLRNSLLEQLESGTVELPGPEDQPMTFELKELGILAPVEFDAKLDAISIPDPKAIGTSATTATRPPVDRRRSGQSNRLAGQDTGISRTAYKFTVQFCWKQIPLRERLKNRRAKEAGEELAAGE